METQQKIVLIAMIILMIGMVYFAYIHLQQQAELIETYKMALEACQVDDFDQLCRSCTYGLPGWIMG